ncbi:MAG: NAD(P)H-dependent oxidoreductase [Candidatus Saccharimonadales bacterium]
MKILLLVGSGDSNSHSLHLAQAIEAKLQSQGAETDLINLIEYGLPLYDRSIERGNAQDEKTRTFLNKSLEADAFVWATPIYHNSYSSTLKNALDWHHSTKFPGKVVGFASNGGNRSPQACDHLALVARSQHLFTIPTRVCTDQDTDYDDDFNIIEPSILNRIEKFAEELVIITGRVSS